MTFGRVVDQGGRHGKIVTATLVIHRKGNAGYAPFFHNAFHQGIQFEVLKVSVPVLGNDNIVCKPVDLAFIMVLAGNIAFAVGEGGAFMCGDVHDHEVFTHVFDNETDTFVFQSQIQIFFVLPVYFIRLVTDGAYKRGTVFSRDKGNASVMQFVLILNNGDI